MVEKREEEAERREIKRRYREKTKKEKVLTGKVGKKTAKMRYHDLPGSCWKTKQNGKRGGTIQLKHQRTNWYHPYLWLHINKVAPKCHWSPQLIVTTLKRNHPALYQRLNCGTVHKWMSNEGPKRWSEKTLENVARQHSLAGSGQVGVLVRYPEIVEEITMKLKELRASGVPVNTLIRRSIMLAVIKAKKPEILACAHFKCSKVAEADLQHQRYVRMFFESQMNWSPRKGTRAAAHVPANAQDVLERTFFHFIWLYQWEKILSKLWINLDQTGVILLPGNSYTWNDKGAKQVDVTAKDEKRAYTLVVAIWARATDKSLLKSATKGMDEAKGLGFHFVFVKSDEKTSHFSTLKTMKETATPSTFAKTSVTMYERNTPSLLFTMFRRTWLVDCHCEQIDKGLSPEQVKFSTSLPVLHDASVQPAVNVYNFYQGPHGRDLVKKAWEMCKAKDWCLSEEVITSKKAHVALKTYLVEHPKFRDEIENRLGRGVTALVAEPASDDHDDDLDGDDSDVPLSVVIKNVFGLEIPEADVGTADCVEADTVDLNAAGRLVAGCLEENVEAYREDGELWDVVGGGSDAPEEDN
ncbi:hypothetical protein JAAARDRAFT_46004 [Jaapia argillacea MUCL 33604]|uniref:DDE-1 domain-containing protein n=1 Tax=Jaapia argillacea MUCL 33604 TaxID=933084 RepID=A0A067PZF5_9AGAM|nr:hypothetical protein JAAARDRAFT_46004 [Jaapia argillacea MUCL 33604]